MNIWNTIKNFIIGVVAKPLIGEVGDLLEKQLRKMATEKPKLFKTLVVSAYVAAKEYGVDLVASTTTDLDDKGLQELIDALETVAAEFGIDLGYETEKINSED